MKKVGIAPVSFSFSEELADDLRKKYYLNEVEVELFEGRKVTVYGITSRTIRKEVWKHIKEYSEASGILVSKIDDLSVMKYGKNDGYGTHSDISLWDSPKRMRKISFIVQLSNPDEYTGGDVCLFDSGKTFVLPRKKCEGIMFPSFVSHTVTPVKSGTRLSIVCWALGECWQ